MQLETVPFFPQSRYQCGPAALATVLSASGVPVTPDSLVDEVYLPERRGSLQIELQAAARRRGRLPYPIEPELAGLLAELDAGHPVLVLQNLGLSWLPRWHYAVVVGFDAGQQTLELRSGRQAQRRERLQRFLRSWRLGGYWGIVTLSPGELPASGTPGRYLRSVVDSAAVLDARDLSKALESGVLAWPDDPDLKFALANQHLEMGRPDSALTAYRAVLALDPTHAGALNNSADLLREQGCLLAAAELIEAGLTSLDADSPLRPTLLATREQVRAEAAGGAPEDARCQNARDKF